MSTVLLQTFRAWTVSGTRCQYIRGIVDSGSSRTFIREDLARELGLKEVAQVWIGINTFASDSECRPAKRSVVEVTVRSQYTHEDVKLAAIVIPVICRDIQESPVDNEHVLVLQDCGELIADVVAFPGMRQLNGISLLIGSDQVWKLISGEIRRYGKQEELVAIETILGWTFQGPSQVKALVAQQADSLICVLRTNVNCVFLQDEEIRQMWEIENAGINEGAPPTAFTSNVLAEFQRTVKMANDSYEVRLPWKNVDAPLHDNRAVAERRLNRLVKRLAVNDALVREYDKNIRAYLLNDHAEPVPISEAKTPERIYYMPHREVIRPECTTTKMRVVFDASSHSGNCTSLNDHLEKGPKVQPDLLGTLEHHFRKVTGGLKDTADVLASSFYVDDLLTGAQNLESAVKLYNDANEVMETAHMRLRKWTSNCSALEGVFRHEKESSTKNNPVTKVLGVVWDKRNDTLACSLDSIVKSVHVAGTKRNVLQASARIYDPLGFLHPFTVRARMIFQALWVEEVGWDAEMPRDKQDQWSQWCRELPELAEVIVDRCMFPSGCRNPQLHIFCDASPKGYGAVAYLRGQNEDGSTTATFVLVKSRVAPLKQLTLPRLELMAALIGSRMMHNLKRIFSGIEFESFMWSDSMIALWWIRRPPTEWKQFVSNRVDEIQQKTDRRRWKHCPGTENPADYLTRGVTAEILIRTNVWWHGPDWLLLEPSSWPDDDLEWDTRADDKRNRKANVLHTSVSSGPPPIDTAKYSTYQRLIRVTAWILRFLNNMRKPENRQSGCLVDEEMKRAEKFWVQQAQAEHYAEEIAQLQTDRTVAPESKLAALRPYLDDSGIIRLQTRLQYGSEAEDVKCPVILPREHHFTKLVVDQGHRRALHGGLQDTLNDIRERWWIPQGRQITKKIIFRCATCSRHRLQAASAPTAPLPPERIVRNQPFEVVGVDFAGSVMVRSGSGTSKSYIALFTCATTRAVHLELVSDLTARSFLLAFRRFIARRGLPTTVYSDNALTFKKTSREIQKLQSNVRKNEVQDYFANHRIKWRFIAEKAAWWGGWWERLVRTMKQSLRKVLGRQSLKGL
ncbi:uncharacterized protein LOC135375287 [Ornithodoros turicata]|uniref:uncharacterized protein LOC135375287 n=1 Tax=Ornithodoros turicata TaxID=34597 RepID=UPI003139B812